MPENGRLSSRLEDLAKLAQLPEVTLGELIDHLTLTGHMFLCLFFCLPFLLPIPIPGLSTPFGIVVILAAGQFVLGREPALPKRWHNTKVNSQTVGRMLENAARWWKKIEHIVKPRFVFLTKDKLFQKVNGMAVVILGVILALPMPPGFNAMPSLAIIALTVGSLEDDGLLILMGYVLFFLNIALVIGLFTIGVEGVRRILLSI
jgi:hypothetical protein